MISYNDYGRELMAYKIMSSEFANTPIFLVLNYILLLSLGL